MPEVSVVIPTRNRSRLLALTLHSVRWQRGVDLEVLVVDDGSADDTAETVAGLADPRIRLLRHDRPQGVSAARNRGIAAAGGAWVAFLDDDDLWAPDKLARQLEAAHQTGRTWVYTGEVSMDERLRILDGRPPAPPEQVLERLVRHNAVPAGASNVVVQADTLARAGAFDTRLRNNEDWDLWIRLARIGPPGLGLPAAGGTAGPSRQRLTEHGQNAPGARRDRAPPPHPGGPGRPLSLGGMVVATGRPAAGRAPILCSRGAHR